MRSHFSGMPGKVGKSRWALSLHPRPPIYAPSEQILAWPTTPACCLVCFHYYLFAIVSFIFLFLHFFFKRITHTHKKHTTHNPTADPWRMDSRSTVSRIIRIAATWTAPSPRTWSTPGRNCDNPGNLWPPPPNACPGPRTPDPFTAAAVAVAVGVATALMAEWPAACPSPAWWPWAVWWVAVARPVSPPVPEDRVPVPDHAINWTPRTYITIDREVGK